MQNLKALCQYKGIYYTEFFYTGHMANEYPTEWKMQSERFRANMRAARMAGADEAGYQEAMKIASDYEQKQLVPCPHCERTFNEEAAKRHIPICGNKARMNQLKNGPPKPGAKKK